jgi:hypothetical protein
VEILASRFDECEIDVALLKWANVGMPEKPGVQSGYVMLARNSSFTVNSLFSDLATVVHRKVN